MLLEAAIGDAFGAGYEYVPHKGVHNPDKLVYVQHPRHRDTRPGMYTDDTQMALAISELLLSENEWNAYNVAERFLTCFQRDPRGGYAKGFHGFLTETKSADAFLANIRANSDKSGAAMRASAIGLLPDIKQVVEYTSIQASVTHNSTDGINSAIASSLMVHYFAYAFGTRKRLPHWIWRAWNGWLECCWWNCYGGNWDFRNFACRVSICVSLVCGGCIRRCCNRGKRVRGESDH